MLAHLFANFFTAISSSELLIYPRVISSLQLVDQLDHQALKRKGALNKELTKMNEDQDTYVI